MKSWYDGWLNSLNLAFLGDYRMGDSNGVPQVSGWEEGGDGVSLLSPKSRAKVPRRSHQQMLARKGQRQDKCRVNCRCDFRNKSLEIKPRWKVNKSTCRSRQRIMGQRFDPRTLNLKNSALIISSNPHVHYIHSGARKFVNKKLTSMARHLQSG